MKYTKLLFLVALACLGACATPARVVDYYDLPSGALHNLRGMEFLSEQVVSEGDYANLGIVAGFSCGHVPKGAVNGGESEPRRKAVEQLKLNAAALGGEHVTTPHCVVRDKIDFTNNCTASITCTGYALRQVAAAP